MRLLPTSDGQVIIKYDRVTRRGSRQGATGALGGDVTGASRSGGAVPARGVGVGGDPINPAFVKSELRGADDDTD